MVTKLDRLGRSLGHDIASDNVHFYGTHSVDIDGEFAGLDTDGYRPLRLAEAGRAHS